MCHQTKPNFLAFLVGEEVWMTILTKVSSLMGCGCDSILKGVYRMAINDVEYIMCYYNSSLSFS